MRKLKDIKDNWESVIEGWTLVALGGKSVTYAEFIENVQTHAQDKHLDEFKPLYSDWASFTDDDRFKYILGDILATNAEVRYRKTGATATVVWSDTLNSLALWNHSTAAQSTAFKPSMGKDYFDKNFTKK